MGYHTMNMEDCVPESDLNCADLAQEASVAKNVSDLRTGFVVFWGRAEVVGFCPCLKSLPRLQERD